MDNSASGESPISLSPSLFRRMLKLIEPMITFKGDEAKELLKARSGGFELLQEYLEDLATIPKDLSYYPC
jgi:hypothetical protein